LNDPAQSQPQGAKTAHGVDTERANEHQPRGMVDTAHRRGRYLQNQNQDRGRRKKQELVA